MKKLITFLSIILLIFPLSSCANNYINTQENGDIKNYEIKNQYIDGSYMAVGDYFDNDGKTPFIKINVKDSLINKVNFDYIYTDATLFSKKSSDNIENLDITLFHIKNLNSKVIQEQGKISDDDPDYKKITSDYKKVLNKVLENAKNGDTEISPVNINQTYSAVYEKDNLGYYSTLTASYKDNIINKVSFEQTNEQGENKNENSSFIEEYSKRYEISYKKRITSLEDMSVGNDKLDTLFITEYDDVLSIYNTLAKEINKKRIAFNIKDYPSLSNSK